MKTIKLIIVGGYSVAGLVLFIFLVPIMYVPTSHHQECDRYHCVVVDYYSSISYHYRMVGGIYSTGGKYWLEQPMRY
ncbi:MAG: hypothetical protein ACREBI_12040 [Nitrosotalea sp.]